MTTNIYPKTSNEVNVVLTKLNVKLLSWLPVSSLRSVSLSHLVFFFFPVDVKQCPRLSLCYVFVPFLKIKK